MGPAKKFYTYKERLDKLSGTGRQNLQAQSYEPYKQLLPEPSIEAYKQTQPEPSHETQNEQAHEQLKPFHTQTDPETYNLNNITEWEYLRDLEALKYSGYFEHPQIPEYNESLANENMIDPAYYINESKNSKASSSSSTNPKMDTTPHDSIDKNIATLYEDTKEKANKLVTNIDLAHKNPDDHADPKQKKDKRRH
uniref:Uncharacterized protein n=1 Tax=Meloidogyne enterolobii TaxID=390850 RepID=A0A6V7V5Q5_MELEN|nr:unnamed protein product [Meloidogyne enterolobii]